MLPTCDAPRRCAWWMRRSGGGSITGCWRVICDIKVEVRGREHMPAGAALIAPKHQCMFDIFGAFAWLPDSCFVSRKEFMRIPFFGWYIWKSRMIVVDREGGAEALKQAGRRRRDRLAHDRQMVIFPEGHRGEPGVAGDYKPGVAALYRELGMPCTSWPSTPASTGQRMAFCATPAPSCSSSWSRSPPGLKRADFMRTLEDRIETASTALLGL